MPYAMLEPIRNLIYSAIQADRTDADKRWLTLLIAAGLWRRGRAGGESRAR